MAKTEITEEMVRGKRILNISQCWVSSKCKKCGEPNNLSVCWKEPNRFLRFCKNRCAISKAALQKNCGSSVHPKHCGVSSEVKETEGETMSDNFTEYIDRKIKEETDKREKAAEAHKNRENSEDAYHLYEWHHHQGRLQGYEDSLVQYKLTNRSMEEYEQASESAGRAVAGKPDAQDKTKPEAPENAHENGKSIAECECKTCKAARSKPSKKKVRK
jgi:hypothetical protein